MMIATLRPYGSINDKSIQYRFENKGKFYVVDKGYNPIEVSESEYMKLKCPVRKMI